MQIEDGTGSGKTVKVNDENRLQSDCITIDRSKHTNISHGDAYTLFSSINSSNVNPSADIESPCIFYIKNTNELDLIITEVRMWAQENEYIDIYIKQTGTPVGGNAVTPINMNLNSGRQATGTFLAASRITGMSGGTFFDRLRVSADNQDHTFKWEPTIIIPKNNILTCYAGNGSILTETSLTFYYHENS